MPELHTLRNGLRFLHDVRSSPRTGIAIGIGRGASDVPSRYLGWLHLIEHLFSVRPQQDLVLARELDGNGIDLNASTSSDLTLLFADCPSRRSTFAFERMVRMLLNPPFDQPDLEEEIDNIHEERAGDGENVASQREVLKDQLLYPGHSLSTSILGRPSSLARVTTARLGYLWSRLLDPRHVVLSVAGPGHARRWLRLVRQTLGRLSVPDRPIRRRHRHMPAFPQARCLFRRGRSDQVHFAWVIRLPGYAVNDRIALQLLSNCLGGRTSSVLFHRLRKGLMYDYAARIWFYPEIGYIELTGDVSPGKFTAAFTRIAEELASLQISGLDPAEYHVTISHYRHQFLKHHSDPLYSAKFWAGQLLNHGRIISLRRFRRTLSRISRREVNAAAARYLVPDNYYFTAVGPLSRAQRRFVRSFLH